MKLIAFQDKVKDFLTFLEVEKNVSRNTLRAYNTDLKQLVVFWTKIQQNEKGVLIQFNEVVRRYVLALFYKKISKATLARKLSCLKSFAMFLRSIGIKLVLNCKAPKLDKKLPTILSVDEIFYLLDSVKNEEMPTRFP